MHVCLYEHTYIMQDVTNLMLNSSLCVDFNFCYASNYEFLCVFAGYKGDLP